MHSMDHEQSVHKAIVQAVRMSCCDEIEHWKSIRIAVQLTIFVDDCNKLDYSFMDLINRSDQCFQMKKCVDKEVQTVLKENKSYCERSQSLQDREHEEVLLVKTEISDGDETATENTCIKDIAKVMPDSPQPHSQGTGLQNDSVEDVACHMCAVKFSDSDQKKEHLKVCHDARNWFPCKICQNLFPSVTILEKHIKDIHETKKTVIRKGRIRQQKPLKVEVDETKSVQKVKIKMAKSNRGKVKKNAINKSRNMRGHKRIVKKKKEESDADIDDEEGENVASFGEVKGNPKVQRTKKIFDESFIPANEGAAQVKCANCGKCYKSKRALRRHFSVVHDLEEFQCEICGKHFNGKESLYHHKRGIHDNLKPYKCTEPGCDATFSFNHSLRLHKLKHSGARPHMCNFCGKTYLTADHLKVHIQATHSEKKNFSCKFCGKLFSYSTSLKMHEMAHEKEERVKCEQCEKTFVNKQVLKYHVLSKHSDPGCFPCDECGKICKTDYLLRSHKRRHTADNRFMCDLCGRQFMYKSTLEMHKACHKDEKNYECKICKKTFKTYPTLYSHQYVHKEDSPYECSECGKTFKTKERLKAHSRRHSGSKPFECLQCHHCFPDKGGLSKHTRTVHCSVKKFVCDICGKATSRADNLRVHMKVHIKGEYKPKQHTQESKSAKTNCQNLPSFVSSSFDINNFHHMKIDQHYNDDSSADSTQSYPSLHNERKVTVDEFQSALPQFATLDSTVIAPHLEEQVLPLDLQNRIRATNTNNYEQSEMNNQNMVTISEHSNMTSVHEMESTPSTSLPSSSIINLQSHTYMYPLSYMYPQGVQSQHANVSGFFGHN